MAFCTGNRVEVCSKEEGFLGSYYEATVVTQFENNSYLVEYETLLKNDESGPLQETVSAEVLRPIPPKVVVPKLGLYDKVDAYHNDGWWVGKIIEKKRSKYYVYFDTSEEEIGFPVSQLRIHLERQNGRWVSSKIKWVSSKKPALWTRN